METELDELDKVATGISRRAAHALKKRNKVEAARHYLRTRSISPPKPASPSALEALKITNAPIMKPEMSRRRIISLQKDDELSLPRSSHSRPIDDLPPRSISVDLPLPSGGVGADAAERNEEARKRRSDMQRWQEQLHRKRIYKPHPLKAQMEQHGTQPKSPEGQDMVRVMTPDSLSAPTKRSSTPGSDSRRLLPQVLDVFKTPPRTPNSGTRPSSSSSSAMLLNTRGSMAALDQTLSLAEEHVGSISILKSPGKARGKIPRTLAEWSRQAALRSGEVGDAGNSAEGLISRLRGFGMMAETQLAAAKVRGREQRISDEAERQRLAQEEREKVRHDNDTTDSAEPPLHSDGNHHTPTVRRETSNLPAVSEEADVDEAGGEDEQLADRGIEYYVDEDEDAGEWGRSVLTTPAHEETHSRIEPFDGPREAGGGDVGEQEAKPAVPMEGQYTVVSQSSAEIGVQVELGVQPGSAEHGTAAERQKEDTKHEGEQLLPAINTGLNTRGTAVTEMSQRDTPMRLNTLNGPTSQDMTIPSGTELPPLQMSPTKSSAKAEPSVQDLGVGEDARENDQSATDSGDEQNGRVKSMVGRLMKRTPRGAIRTEDSPGDDDKAEGERKDDGRHTTPHLEETQEACRLLSQLTDLLLPFCGPSVVDLAALLHSSIYSSLHVVNTTDSNNINSDYTSPIIDFGDTDSPKSPESRLQQLPYYDLTHRLRVQYAMANDDAERARGELAAAQDHVKAAERRCKMLEEKEKAHETHVDKLKEQISELDKDNQRWFSRFKEANNDKYGAERTVKLYGQEREMLITENDLLAGKLEELDPESRATQLCLAQAFKTGSYVFERDLDLHLENALGTTTDAANAGQAAGGRGRRRLSITVSYDGESTELRTTSTAGGGGVVGEVSAGASPFDVLTPAPSSSNVNTSSFLTTTPTLASQLGVSEVAGTPERMKSQPTPAASVAASDGDDSTD